jgi:hypothetical protein
MKKLTHWFAMAALLFAFNSTILKAEKAIDPVSMDPVKTEQTITTSAETNQAILSTSEAELAMVSSAETSETAYANALLDRLNEIKEMDMSAMSSSEKNELRKEVRAIEKEQRPSGGVYISVGAAILIVLLLILLL